MSSWHPGDGSTLYVHVPFCVVKCGYCDFFSVADASTESHDRFLDGLALELAALDLQSNPRTVFIGGGTPSYLDSGRLRRLFDLLGQHVDLLACREVTIEANPESLTVEKASIALDAGVSRFSVGAQSFDPERLRFLDRAHDATGTRDAIAALRDAGVTNVSIDLMFGLPDQSLAEWQNDLRTALSLEPDHMSCYNLTFEAGTRLRRDFEQGRVAPNDPDHDLELFDWTRDELSARGFQAYEISNFAGEGGPCLHNDHYWLQGNYHGVGPGASSHHDGVRTTNTKSIHAWAERLAAGQPAFVEREELDPEQRLGEALWLGLRRSSGVDLEQISDRIGLDPRQSFSREFDRFEHTGHLSRDKDRVQLTRAGVRVADRVAEAFLAAR